MKLRWDFHGFSSSDDLGNLSQSQSKKHYLIVFILEVSSPFFWFYCLLLGLWVGVLYKDSFIFLDLFRFFSKSPCITFLVVFKFLLGCHWTVCFASYYLISSSTFLSVTLFCVRPSTLGLVESLPTPLFMDFTITEVRKGSLLFRVVDISSYLLCFEGDVCNTTLSCLSYGLVSIVISLPPEGDSFLCYWSRRWKVSLF